MHYQPKKTGFYRFSSTSNDAITSRNLVFVFRTKPVAYLVILWI